jgi:serine/threonine-protein kinase HipA
MHLKIFSLITKNNKTTLAPIYDFLNSTIAIKIQKRKYSTEPEKKK